MHLKHKKSKTLLKSATSSCAPSLWNNVLPTSRKSINSFPLFQSELKDFLINLNNEQHTFKSSSN